jgi:hypothetical protein
LLQPLIGPGDADRGHGLLDDRHEERLELRAGLVLEIEGCLVVATFNSMFKFLIPEKGRGAVAVSGNLLRIPPCRNLHSVIVRPATTITHLPFIIGDFKIIYNILK